jgi:hypothetical protein
MLYPLSYGGVIRTSPKRVTPRHGSTTLAPGKASLKARAAWAGGVEACAYRDASGSPFIRTNSSDVPAGLALVA